MKKTETQQNGNKLKTVMLYIVSFAVIFLTVLFIFFVLNGGFELVS